MKKKTKHIIIIILSVIVWLVGLIITGYFDLGIRLIIFVIQLLVIFFGWHRSFTMLEKIKAATKLLELINERDIDDLNTYNGICSLILFEANDLKKYNKYVELLEPTKKQRLKFGNQSSNTVWWFNHTIGKLVSNI